MMMQMMGLLTQMVANQGTPAQSAPPKQAKPAPTERPAPGKNVTFSGDFGRFRVQYADALVEQEFIVLVSKPNQATMYEPPLSPDKPLNLMIDGKAHTVLNLGLSFNHKGDILLLMPKAIITEDSNAEKTE
jgi:hypothetical protein